MEENQSQGAGPKLFTEEDVDRIVARRVKDANLAIWSKGINGSLAKNTKAIEELSALVKEHIALPMHPAQSAERAKLIEEFGLDTLTVEQRRALPLVLAGAVNLQAKHTDELARAAKREKDWQRTAQVFMLVSISFGILSTLGVFTALRHALHLP